jgi:hypothetical protein
MPTEFSIRGDRREDGPLVSFGPLDAVTASQLAIPGSLVRRVSYPALALEVELSCAFTGDRLEIVKMTIVSQQSYIATKDLTQLALPQVIREIVCESVPNSDHWLIQNTNSLNHPRSDAFLAQLYWFEHVSWGSPRATLMTFMGWSRPYANTRIKKISKEIKLPGAHSAER